MPIPTKYLLSLNKAYRAYRANRTNKAYRTDMANSGQRLIVFYWANSFYLAN